MKSRVFFSMVLLLLGAAAAMAESSATAARPRRLVLCLDGTLNSPEQSVQSVGKHELYKPTNVLKTFRAISPVSDDGVSQIAYYSEGVGSFIGEPDPFGRLAEGLDRASGGVWAVGYEARVKSAYRFLVANYRPGDQIFIFGFSRGAAEAQTLVLFVQWIGGVLGQEGQGGVLHKEDEYYIPELYDGFRASKPVGNKPAVAAKAVFDEIRKRRRKQDAIEQPQPARIEFLGVYETVVSVGSRVARDGTITTVAPKYAFLVDPKPPTIVNTIRQALAIDEQRWDFRPQIWQPTAERGSQSLVQLWFPGVHSNVGGGFRYDGLADAALGWMLDEAEKVAPLALDRCYLEYFLGVRAGCPNPQRSDLDSLNGKAFCYEPSRPDSDTLLYRFLDAIRFKSGRGVRDLATWDKEASGWERAGLGFHESLGMLLISDCTYRPKNLLEYLAGKETRIDDFPPAQHDAILQIVEQFKAKTENCQPPRCRMVVEKN